MEVLTPEVHDSGHVGQCDEDANEDKEGGFEVGEEKDCCEVDGHDGETDVAMKLAPDDLKNATFSDQSYT